MYKPDLSAADQCVMCGMCQPHCPTYQVHHIESESPRGRLSMILGIAQGQLKADDSVLQHLYNCTGCGACEAICPSRVPYMQLLDDSKYLLRSKTRHGLANTILLWLVRHPARYGLLKKLLQSARLGNTLRRFGLLDKQTHSIQRQVNSKPALPQLQSLYHARGQVKGDIALFTGCITQLFDQQSLEDSIALLTYCGYNVHLPAGQACCGAMHQHNGQPDIATELLERNRQLFNSKRFDAIIGSATGCVSQLKAINSDRPVIDIMQFIAEHQLIEQLDLKPLKQRISVHQPCSQQYNATIIEQLIQAIPGTTIHPLNSNATCCGAGGTQLIKPTSSSLALQQIKANDIQKQNPEVLVTTNYGCALQMASGLYEALSEDKQIEICHPVSLLVKSASLK